MNRSRDTPDTEAPSPPSDRDREVGDLFAARGAAIRASAYLLCGDWHLANDLTQTAFTKLYLAWHRVHRAGSAESYLRRTLVRAFLDERRRPWRREKPTEDFTGTRGGPSPASATEQVDNRMVLRHALAAVPPRQRAVLVLRFWDDLSVEETAAALRITPGTVKSQCARGLTTLRTLLPAEWTDGFAQAEPGDPANTTVPATSRSTRHA